MFRYYSPVFNALSPFRCRNDFPDDQEKTGNKQFGTLSVACLWALEKSVCKIPTGTKFGIPEKRYESVEDI